MIFNFFAWSLHEISEFILVKFYFWYDIQMIFQHSLALKWVFLYILPDLDLGDI